MTKTQKVYSRVFKKIPPILYSLLIGVVGGVSINYISGSQNQYWLVILICSIFCCGCSAILFAWRTQAEKYYQKRLANTDPNPTGAWEEACHAEKKDRATWYFIYTLLILVSFGFFLIGVWTNFNAKDHTNRLILEKLEHIERIVQHDSALLHKDYKVDSMSLKLTDSILNRKAETSKVISKNKNRRNE